MRYRRSQNVCFDYNRIVMIPVEQRNHVKCIHPPKKPKTGENNFPNKCIVDTRKHITYPPPPLPFHAHLYSFNGTNYT